MEAKSTAAIVAAPEEPKEKILFETQPMMLPTILNIENLTLIGITIVIAIAMFAFRLGFNELLVIGLVYLLLAIPSFVSIFRAGSTYYVLTTRRLIIFKLAVGDKEQSIPLTQVTGTKIRHSGLQRIYGAGDIIVYQKGLRKPVRLGGLKGCKRLAEQINQAAKKYQNKA